MQGSIKYHFLILWYNLTWDWTLVSNTISKHSTHWDMSGIYIHIYIYIYLQKLNCEPDLRFNFCNWLLLIMSPFCNCSIAAFCSGFSFSFDQLIAYLLIFFQLVWRSWPFRFSLPIIFFFFPPAVIWDLLSLNSGRQGFFSFSWSLWTLVVSKLVTSIYIYIYVYNFIDHFFLNPWFFFLLQ